MSIRLSQPWTDRKGTRHTIGTVLTLDQRTEAHLIEGGYARPDDGVPAKSGKEKPKK